MVGIVSGEAVVQHVIQNLYQKHEKWYSGAHFTLDKKVTKWSLVSRHLVLYSKPFIKYFLFSSLVKTGQNDIDIDGRFILHSEIKFG